MPLWIAGLISFIAANSALAVFGHKIRVDPCIREHPRFVPFYYKRRYQTT
jgi:hypothetical protein